jgi:hypothetical protein
MSENVCTQRKQALNGGDKVYLLPNRVNAGSVEGFLIVHNDPVQHLGHFFVALVLDKCLQCIEKSLPFLVVIVGGAVHHVAPLFLAVSKEPLKELFIWHDEKLCLELIDVWLVKRRVCSSDMKGGINIGREQAAKIL